MIRTFTNEKPTPIKEKFNPLARELRAGNRNKTIAHKMYARHFIKPLTNEDTNIKSA